MQSLRRGIAVIESIKSHEPCGLHQIHQDTGLPKPTLLRILDTLESLGVVFRPIDDKRYRLGANGILASRDRDIRAVLQEVSVPILMNLCRDIAWPSDLVIPDGNSMVVVASNRMLSPFPIKPTGHGHHPDMLLTAVGRIYLACSDADTRNAIIQGIRMEQPDHPLLQNIPTLETLLAETKAKGYGVRSDYKHDGFGAIAVPVFVGAKPIACLNLFYYRSAVSLENIVSDHLDRLNQAAQAIGRSAASLS
ncbi:MAG: IclR family transcriptional regulator C-terminal domain-containing protein [Nitratireductor sp.]